MPGLVEYLGIARERIAWFPVIQPDLCSGCGECADLCANDVFKLNEDIGVMDVVNPYNCVVLCDKCAPTCPTEALRFPDKAEIKQELMRLLAEKRAARAGAAE